MKYKYDKEADVLAVFLSRKPFLYAKEMGDVIVHFDKGGKPVYLEFLNAHNFLEEITMSLPKETQLKILKKAQPSTDFAGAHQI